MPLELWRPNSSRVPTISLVTFEGEARFGLGIHIKPTSAKSEKRAQISKSLRL
jgi:hypothetical protein